jgi:hypothetical protein
VKEMERIIRHLRNTSIKTEAEVLESQLVEMASDTEIQCEIRKINEEFSAFPANPAGKLPDE